MRAFAALQRDQFISGYDDGLKPETSKLVNSYFTKEILVKAHRELEKIANRVLELLCAYVGYSEFEPLQSRLSNEKDTPGILRLLRYAPKALGEQEERVTELAADHTDLGLISLMPHSEAESLQIMSQQFDWINIERGQPKDSIVVIIGEQLAFLSNYRLQAVRHRVIPSPSLIPRFSLPFLLRMPADFELAQAGTEKRRVTRDIRNHIFELSNHLHSASHIARRLQAAYANVAAASKRSTRLVAASIAQDNDPKSPPSSWPVILFFDGKLPSNATHRRFKRLCEECEDTSSPKELEPEDKHLIVQANYKGWNPSQWALHSVSSFECTFEGQRFLVISVAQDDVAGEDLASSDLRWTILSMAVLAGRPYLEANYDLNPFRRF